MYLPSDLRSSVMYISDLVLGPPVLGLSLRLTGLVLGLVLGLVY